jgi:hypothetical protein
MSDYPQADEIQAGATKRRYAIEMGALALLAAVFLIVSFIRQNPFAEGADSAKAIGIIVAAGLTLIMFSFLYRDNPLFKIGENLYVGVALGYTVVITWREFLRPLVYKPLFEAPTAAAFNNSLLHLAVPVILGILLLGRISRKHGWVSRYAYAIMIGWGAGVAIPLYTNSYILQQLTAAVKPLQEAAVTSATTQPAYSQAWLFGTAGPIFGALVAMIGTVAVLFYFFFSVEHKRLGSAVSKVGIWFLMISFGASFGFTVMGRLSLLIGRVNFLLNDWLNIPVK